MKFIKTSLRSLMYFKKLKMKKITALLSAFILSFGFVLSAQASFSDEITIPEHALFPIKILKQKNIISGNADGSFRPAASVNRAEFCKILVNATGVETYIPAIASFPDVEPGDWFYEYVETAKYYGWVKGYPDGSFRPGGKINRAEVAKILVSAFEFETTDSPNYTNWFDKYVRVLKNRALLPHGIDGDEFGAGDYPARAEVSEQIYRFMINTGKLSSYDLVLQEEEEAAIVDTTEAEAEAEAAEDEIEEVATEESTENTPEAVTVVDDSVSVDVLINPTLVSPQAGTLSIAKKKGLPLKVTVRKDHKDLSVLSMEVTATDGNVRLGGMQFRRIGNGDYTAFTQAWVVIGGQRVSSKVEITGDILAIDFPETVTIASGATKSVDLYVDLSGKGSMGDSSRFVLYLPDWISANSDKKVGFFPFGGIDIEIK